MSGDARALRTVDARIPIVHEAGVDYAAQRAAEIGKQYHLFFFHSGRKNLKHFQERGNCHETVSLLLRQLFRRPLTDLWGVRALVLTPGGRKRVRRNLIKMADNLFSLGL